MKKLDAGNLLSGVRSNTLIAGLFAVLVISIVLLFANFFYLGTLGVRQTVHQPCR